MDPHRQDLVDSVPITGELVRRYRKLLGLQQSEFANRWGLSQGALSQIEGGRLAISEDRATLLAKAFAGKRGEVPFPQFARQFSHERRQSLPLVGHPTASYATLVTWRWSEDIDLAAEPVGLAPAGLVTLRLEHGVRALALEAPLESDERHEILVFVPTPFAEIDSGDLVLYQPVGKGPLAAVIASVEHTGVTSSRRTRLHSMLPREKRGREVRAEDVAALLRCVYRARYIA